MPVHRDNSQQSTSLWNAFNRMSRYAVLAQVLKVFTSVTYTLGCRSHLYLSKFLLSSLSDVQQGDPLSPILLAVAIHPFVRHLSSIQGIDIFA